MMIRGEFCGQPREPGKELVREMSLLQLVKSTCGADGEMETYMQVVGNYMYTRSR